MIKKRLMAFFIILPILLSAGCWSSKEIDTLAISICIGIDKTENGYLVSEQILNPKAIASKKVINEAPVIIYSAEGRDLDETIRGLTTQLSRKIYNAHLRMVVLGEEVAKDGINNILDYFVRNHEYRTDFYFVVAKNVTASKVLSILTPLESIPGIDMYNSLKLSSEEWAATKAIRIIDLVNSIVADGMNPVLTGIEITSGESASDSTQALEQTNELKKLKYTTLGAFKNDKLAGWLDEDESKGYNYITGNVKRTIGYVLLNDNVKISAEVIKAKSTIKASLKNGKPTIDVKIDIQHNITMVAGDFDITKEENIKIFNKLAAEKTISLCTKALSKAQQLKTDIFGFGEQIRRQYPDVWASIKDNWANEFLDTPVAFTVSFKTNQLGEITQPFFIKEKE